MESADEGQRCRNGCSKDKQLWKQVLSVGQQTMSTGVIVTNTEMSHGVFNDGQNMDTADSPGRGLTGITTAMTYCN